MVLIALFYYFLIFFFNIFFCYFFCYFFFVIFFSIHTHTSHIVKGGLFLCCTDCSLRVAAWPQPIQHLFQDALVAHTFRYRGTWPRLLGSGGSRSLLMTRMTTPTIRQISAMAIGVMVRLVYLDNVYLFIYCYI